MKALMITLTLLSCTTFAKAGGGTDYEVGDLSTPGILTLKSMIQDCHPADIEIAAQSENKIEVTNKDLLIAATLLTEEEKACVLKGLGLN